MVNEIRSTLSELGVQRQVIDVVLKVFPDETFGSYFGIIQGASQTRSALGELLSILPPKVGLGYTSHTMIVMRELLSLGPESFRNFTRDYVRRCCDVVEISLKASAINHGLISEDDRRPFGAVVKLLVSLGTLPDPLSQRLDEFNRKIYIRAKHEPTRRIHSRKFSAADAAVATIIAMKLSQEVHDTFRSVS